MNVENYFDLKIRVADELGKSDAVDRMAGWTQTAESKLNKQLRCFPQIKVNEITFANGVASAPADYIKEIEWHDEHAASAIPAAFSSVVRFYYPDFGDSTKYLEFYSKLPTLTAGDTATNWLLLEAPEVYIYWVAYEGAEEMRDVEKMDRLAGMKEDVLGDIMRWNLAGKHGISKVKLAGVI